LRSKILPTAVFYSEKTNSFGEKNDTEFLKNGKQKNSILLKSLAKSGFKSSKKIWN
jgi:hypothetical protein